MIDRVVVPVVEEANETSKLSSHFGRAPYFAIAEISTQGQIQNLIFQKNTITHHEGSGKPPALLLSFKPTTIITFEMGPKAIQRFEMAGITVMKATSDRLEDALDAFVRGELIELTDGCGHARHKRVKLDF